MDNEECAPERESAVESAFGKLEREIGMSKELLEWLEMIISPVLSPGVPIAETNEKPKEHVLGTSSLTMTVRGLTERVSAVNELVRSISRRVEL